MKVEGTKDFDAPAQLVWDVLNDPSKMANLLPGVESFDVQDDRHWSAAVKIPLGMGGLKLNFKFEKIEERPIEYAKLSSKGQGVGAIVSMETQFHLTPDGERTNMRWEADVRVAGPIGSMGQRVFQPIVNQQVTNVLNALERQVDEAKRADEARRPLAVVPAALAITSQAPARASCTAGAHAAAGVTYRTFCGHARATLRLGRKTYVFSGGTANHRLGIQINIGTITLPPGNRSSATSGSRSSRRRRHGPEPGHRLAVPQRPARRAAPDDGQADGRPHEGAFSGSALTGAAPVRHVQLRLAAAASGSPTSARRSRRPRAR